MKRFFNSLPAPLRFIILTYFIGIMFFTLLRILLILLHGNLARQIPVGTLLQAIVMGWRFDTVISGYFLIAPLFFFFLFSFFKKGFPVLDSVSLIFITVIYSIGFFISCADIPWFAHDETRLSVAALHWTDSPAMMFAVVFKDIHNYPYLIGFVVLIILFNRILKQIKRNTLDHHTVSTPLLPQTVFFILTIGFTLLGIRGRIEAKSPIRWGTAFFSQYNFANQLGLNPVYTLLRSWLDSREVDNQHINYLDDKVALENVKSFYQTSVGELYSPVARKISPSGDAHKYNIVLVLMESMSAKNMAHFGNTNGLTPVLDSLYDSGIAFSNFYSDGNHTFNGIYSSLFGFPSLPLKHHLKDMACQQPYGGIAKTLLQNGYQTIVFTTHDAQFDNMFGFLTPNGFQQFVSVADYPSEKVLSTLGVPDHVQFENAVKRLTTLSQKGKPFFTTIVTTSNHTPYLLPEGIAFKPHTTEMRTEMIEYADWSIGNFLQQCSHQPWYDSTIFIFTGDHGNLIPGFDHYLAYHQVPLLMYAPKIFSSPQVIENLGGQVDIFATLLHALNISYVNNSFGQDLLIAPHQFLTFTYDEELCCTNGKALFILNQSREQLFEISPDKKTIAPLSDTTLSQSMKTYCRSVMQTAQWMIENRKMY